MAMWGDNSCHVFMAINVLQVLLRAKQDIVKTNTEGNGKMRAGTGNVVVSN